MLSSNNNLLLTTIFMLGFIVGGVVGITWQQIILLIYNIKNDKKQDLIVINYKYVKKHLSFFSNFFTSSNLSNSFTLSIYIMFTKLNQLHIYQKDLYKKQ